MPAFLYLMEKVGHEQDDELVLLPLKPIQQKG